MWMNPDIHKSVAWTKLTPTAKDVYIELCSRIRDAKDIKLEDGYQISHAFSKSQIARILGRLDVTVCKAFDRLKINKFINYKYFNHGYKKAGPAIFVLTDGWKDIKK